VVGVPGRRTGGFGPARRDGLVGRFGHSGVAGAFLCAALLLGATACGLGSRATSSTGSDNAGSAAAPLISCVPGTISGSGSSAQQVAMDVWTSTYSAACKSSISYRAVSSSAGLDDFAHGRTAFGGSDTPPRDAQKASTDARCGGQAVSLPMVVGPIAVVYTLPGVPDLRLTPPILARIFAGSITRWNDPAIQAANVGVVLPAMSIVTVHRSAGSGTTDNFTHFLAKTAETNWPYGTGPNWAAPGGLVAGSSVEMTAKVRQTPGAIGYAELFFAEDAGLLTAKIRNAAGEYVGPSAAAASVGLSTAVAGSGPTDGAATIPDLTVTFDYTSSIPGAYPISLVSYEVVCARGLPPAQAALVRSFLDYAASPAGQQQVSDIGYAPLPQGLASRVRAVVASLR
jgi:phosphate transport system substrate-binding protein